MNIQKVFALTWCVLISGWSYAIESSNGGGAPSASSDPSLHSVVVVMDFSGSMRRSWGWRQSRPAPSHQAGHPLSTRSDYVKDSFVHMVDQLSKEPTHVDLRVALFGSGGHGNCKDARILTQSHCEEVDGTESEYKGCRETSFFDYRHASQRSDLEALLQQARPQGMAPISYALKKVIRDLPQLRKPATVILVADGRDNCNYQACQTIKRVWPTDMRLSVIGIRLNKKSRQSLQCLAQTGHGQLREIKYPDQLYGALTEAVSEAAHVRDALASVNSHEEMHSHL